MLWYSSFVDLRLRAPDLLSRGVIFALVFVCGICFIESRLFCPKSRFSRYFLQVWRRSAEQIVDPVLNYDVADFVIILMLQPLILPINKMLLWRIDQDWCLPETSCIHDADADLRFCNYVYDDDWELCGGIIMDVGYIRILCLDSLSVSRIESWAILSSDLCHVRCACLAGQKIIIKKDLLVFERDRTGFCPGSALVWCVPCFFPLCLFILLVSLNNRYLQYIATKHSNDT